METRPQRDALMRAKPILEQLNNVLRHAVGTQLRRTRYGGIAIPQPLFRGYFILPSKLKISVVTSDLY